MAKPTFWSSGPDPMQRTVCIYDEHSRRAQFGPIRPMQTRQTLIERISRLIPLS